jgi:hypothetical protein
MRPIKAILLTIWIYSTLVWLYCVARITINNIEPLDPFIIGIPIAFWHLGLIAFLVSAICCYGFLIQK